MQVIKYNMLYACLATFGCLAIGLAGLALSLADIERFNFGLYLALLSVVGVTVSIAFWIIAPAACANPRWMQRLTARYGYKFEPVRETWLRHFGKKRRRKRRRSKGTKAASSNRTNRVLVAFTRGPGRERDTDEGEGRASGKEVAAAAAGCATGRRGTDASRDTLTAPADTATLPEEEEMEDESSMEEEADFCPLIASSLASVLAPTLASTRSIPKDQRPVIHLPKMTVATKQSRVPDLETVGEQSAEVTVEAATSSGPYYPTPADESPAPDCPASVPESPIPGQLADSPVPAFTPDSPAPVPRPIPYPEIEIVVVKTSRKTSEIASPSYSAVSNGIKRSHSDVQILSVNFTQNSAVV
ncbi:hypothetical protein PRIPAC_73550 [Pristionchus pacificus]|uniref:Uncharacterized protein n=1 Tax=Pristionchus pacificus TaxID=54126 RepID=A0A8R1YC90_PRIPA|nr:hypothetical protein PRIPAC_73550 [Pristionchus pacificus]|eukprot:PDM74072.1 hypothetical protein PRIPAC_41428 [Pristionchus pacificus]